MTLVSLDLAWVSFCPRPSPRSLGAWRQLRLGQRGPTGPRRGAGDNAGARLPLCRTTPLGWTPEELFQKFQKVPGGPCYGLAQAGRWSGWRAQGGQRGGRWCMRPWGLASGARCPWEEEGPGVLCCRQAHGGVAPSVGHPRANPVITRSGFSLQTPGSVWFLQSHRIWPGPSLSWPGGWGPASLLPFQRPRAQGRSENPCSQQRRDSWTQRHPSGARDPGSFCLGPPQLRVPHKASQAPCLPEAGSEPCGARGPGGVPRETQQQSRGPTMLVAGSSLRQNPRSRRGGPGGPIGPKSQPSRSGVREGLTAAHVQGTLGPQQLPCPPPQRHGLPHSRPCGCLARRGAGAEGVSVLPPDWRGHPDSGLVARVGPTGRLGLVWPHFFSRETGLLLPLRKCLLFPGRGCSLRRMCLRVPVCACVCMCVRAYLCGSQCSGPRKQVGFELAPSNEQEWRLRERRSSPGPTPGRQDPHPRPQSCWADVEAPGPRAAPDRQVAR